MRRNWDHESENVQEILSEQKGRCFYCDNKVHDTFHVDHVVPLSRGGEDSPDNLVIACPECNLDKSDKLLHEWDDRPAKRKRFFGLF